MSVEMHHVNSVSGRLHRLRSLIWKSRFWTPQVSKSEAPKFLNQSFRNANKIEHTSGQEAEKDEHYLQATMLAVLRARKYITEGTIKP